MKPSDIEIEAARSTKSETPALAACEAMTEMPTTEVDWSRICMVC